MKHALAHKQVVYAEDMKLTIIRSIYESEKGFFFDISFLFGWVSFLLHQTWQFHWISLSSINSGVVYLRWKLKGKVNYVKERSNFQRLRELGMMEVEWLSWRSVVINSVRYILRFVIKLTADECLSLQPSLPYLFSSSDSFIHSASLTSILRCRRLSCFNDDAHIRGIYFL